jgi:diaminopimelate epimerase
VICVSASRIPFVKVEGLGNDFVVVDLRPGRPGEKALAALDPDVVRAVCDRHFGIGGDGILANLPGDKGDARMRVLNADGSEAEMCGNGIRCVAKVLYEDDPTLRRPVLNIDTGAGLLSCAIHFGPGDGTQSAQVETVSVEMGVPRLLRGEIPMTGPANERVLRAPLEVTAGGVTRTFGVTGVSMGNPHAVIFVDDPAVSLRELAETFGPTLETSPTFPRRTNVEFARVRMGHGNAGPEIDLVVWERGCGITLACGTGACATVVAAALEGRIPAGTEVPVHLPGGTLFIKARQEDASQPTRFAGVLMRGPAARVFSSEVDSVALLQRTRTTAS